MSEPKPSVGRIVHYQGEAPTTEGAPLPAAAIITEVDENKGVCHLCVLSRRGMYFAEARFAETPTPRHWNWPPRV